VIPPLPAIGMRFHRWLLGGIQVNGQAKALCPQSKLRAHSICRRHPPSSNHGYIEYMSEVQVGHWDRHTRPSPAGHESQTCVGIRRRLLPAATWTAVFVGKERGRRKPRDHLIASDELKYPAQTGEQAHRAHLSELCI
jgi:hypothetical protein